MELSVLQISDKTRWTVLCLHDADGRTGWGEATLGGHEKEIVEAMSALAPTALGQAVHGHAQRTGLALQSTHTRAQAAMLSAIDHAMWDLDAQVQGRALAQLLGPVCRQQVPLYANINRGTLNRTPQGFAMRAQEARAAGFDAIKIAPFDNVAHYGRPAADDGAVAAGLERMEAVRAAVGGNCELMVDCHWRLNEALARAVIDVAARCAYRWVECPLPETAACLPAIRALRAYANTQGVLLAGCEEAIGLEGFRPFVEAGAYDVMMPDVKYVGGLAEVLRVADYLQRNGVEFSPHNPSGPIAHAVSLHLSAVVPALRRLELQFRETPLFDALVDPRLAAPESGQAPVPQGPGLGLTLAGAPTLAVRVEHRHLHFDAVEVQPFH
jgi:galactonate dehydratase